MPSTKKAVKKGIKFLNKSCDSGWVYRISLEKLNFIEPKLCVLGQLEENYYNAALDYFDLTDKQAAERGFTSMIEECETCYINLTKEWKKQIRKLRERSSNDKVTLDD